MCRRARRTAISGLPVQPIRRFALTEAADAEYFRESASFGSEAGCRFELSAKHLAHPNVTPQRNRITLHCFACAALLLNICGVSLSAFAQQWQLPGGNAAQIQSAVSSGAVDIPQTNLTPIAPPPAPPPSNAFGQFDPYGTTPNAQFGGGASTPLFNGAGASLVPPPSLGPSPSVFGSVPSLGSAPSAMTAPAPAVIGPPAVTLPSSQFGSTGQIAPSPPGGSLLSRMLSRPASTTVDAGFGSSSFSVPSNGSPAFGAPMYNGGGFTGSGLDTASVYGPPGAYGGTVVPQFPSSVYPSSTPSVLFPGGLFDAGGMWAEGSTIYEAYRLFQGPRVSHEFVTSGSKPTDLQTNTTDASLVFAFPNFLYGARPLFIIPSFSLDLWDGPDGSTGADLPRSAYSAFLDVGWESDPNMMLSSEVGVRVGVFSDFNTYNSDSVRVLGKALVNFRVTPSATLKGGVYYLDRNSIKLLPAGGIVFFPNPFTKVDLFFPQPKISRYVSTLGTNDFWWYLAGDYGGGSWTIQRTNLTEDSVDINELRGVFGIEWGESNAIRAGRRSAFIEAGYVFEREIEYRFNPQHNIKPSNGFMIRAGIGY